MKIPDLGEIAVAWYRATNPTPEQQAIADERLNICQSCEFMKPVGTIPLYNGYKCTACGCPIHKKIFSSTPGPQACPHKKWPR